MIYNYNFLLGSFLFLLLTAYFYFRQSRIHDLQDRLYSMMLCCVMVAAVCDFFASYLNATAPQHPRALLYALNIVLMACVQACLPAFFIYILSTTDTLKEIRRPLRWCIGIPYAVTLGALLISPFGGFGIFYLDVQNYYWGGNLHFLLYADIAIYLLASVFTVIFYSAKIEQSKRNVMICFTSILILAGVIQTMLPNYLITTGATALAVTAMYYFFQSPTEKLDPLTGLFNRTQLPVILKSQEEQGRPYSLVLFQIRYVDEMQRAFGSAATDAVMASFAELLKKRYAGKNIFYMDVARFVVCFPIPPDREELSEWHNSKLIIDGNSMMITVHTAVVPSRENRSVEGTLSLTEYLFKLLLREKDVYLFADSATENACEAAIRLSSNIENLLCQDDTVILFSPCRGRDGQFMGENVSLHIETLQYCYFGSQVEAAVTQKNLIWQYMRRLIEGAAQHRELYSAQHPAFVALPVMACLENQSVEKLQYLVRQYDLEPSKITFSMRESDVAGAIPVVLENITRLVRIGYGFCVDHFAADFTDITLMTRLPITAVQIDPYFMRLAENSDRQQRLLAGLIGVFRDLGKRVICCGSGGETAAQMAFRLGAEEWQSTEEWQE